MLGELSATQDLVLTMHLSSVGNWDIQALVRSQLAIYYAHVYDIMCVQLPLPSQVPVLLLEGLLVQYFLITWRVMELKVEYWTVVKV